MVVGSFVGELESRVWGVRQVGVVPYNPYSLIAFGWTEQLADMISFEIILLYFITSRQFSYF